MRLSRLIFLVIPAAIGLAGGCMPFGFFSDLSADGNGGSAGAGAGGSIEVTITTATSASAGTGMGSGGGAGVPGPISYGYLCGGSSPTCSPDLGSTECAPGGSANVGGGPDAGPSKYSCHLLAGPPTAAVCGVSGETGQGGPCNQATDCQIGLGCAATEVAGVGVCQHYCCNGLEGCPEDTHCLPTKMAEGSAEVPLCMPVTTCVLLSDTLPCPSGQACAIVRNDGTAGCVDIGPGTEGMMCPCADGYTCSYAEGICLKLCSLDGTECGEGICQGGPAQYPYGFGLCIPQSSL